MARRYEDEKLERLFSAFKEYPGERPGFIARLLGWQRSAVIRALPALDNEGLLLYEDEHGGLWPFREEAE